MLSMESIVIQFFDVNILTLDENLRRYHLSIVGVPPTCRPGNGCLPVFRKCVYIYITIQETP